MHPPRRAMATRRGRSRNQEHAASEEHAQRVPQQWRCSGVAGECRPQDDLRYGRRNVVGTPAELEGVGPVQAQQRCARRPNCECRANGRYKIERWRIEHDAEQPAARLGI